MIDRETDILLLKAAALPPERAIKYFEKWEQRVIFEEIEWDSHCLLPAVYKNLHTTIAGSRLFPKIKGIHKKAWLENQIRIPRLEQIYATLNERNIDFIVLSNFFNLFDRFGEKDVFSLDAFEIWIKPDDVRSTIAHLQKMNWDKMEKDLMLSDFIVLTYRKTMKIKLSWNTDTFDKNIWERSQVTSTGKNPIRVLEPTDQILYLCRHQELLNRTSLLLNNLLKENSDIGWEKLVFEAEARRISTSLLDVFDYLTLSLDLEIPEEFRDQLLRNSKTEFAGRRPITSSYRVLRDKYLRNVPVNNSKVSANGFLRFLCRQWNVNSILALPPEIGKRFYKQIVNQWKVN